MRKFFHIITEYSPGILLIPLFVWALVDLPVFQSSEIGIRQSGGKAAFWLAAITITGYTLYAVVEFCKKHYEQTRKLVSYVAAPVFVYLLLLPAMSLPYKSFSIAKTSFWTMLAFLMVLATLDRFSERRITKT